MSTPCGYQQITDVSASTALTVPPAGAIPSNQQPPTRCIVTCETSAVRWRDDGTAPTSGVGYPLAVGQELQYDGDLKRIRFIQQAASAVLNVSYYY